MGYSTHGTPSGRAWSIAVAIAAAVPTQVLPQARPVVAQVVDDARVVMVDAVTKAETQVYRTNLADGWIEEARVAPSGRLVAVLETRRGRTFGSWHDRLPHNRLVVLDGAGRVVAVDTGDVRRFAWCCEGGQLAIIAGEYYEGGPGFRTDAIYLLDVASGSVTHLSLPSRPSRVVWAAFDTSLYFGSPAGSDSLEVWRYKVSTGVSTRTPYWGMRFSPSGSYYLAYSTGLRGRPGWHVVERTSGRETAVPDTSIGAIEGWAFSSGHQLLLLHGRPETVSPGVNGRRAATGRIVITSYAIYDVASRRVTARGQGALLDGGSASHGAVPVRRGASIEVLRGPSQ